MNYREPNDAGQDADKHNDKLFVDVDAEWLQQQQEAAFQTALDAGCFDYPDNANVIEDANAVSLSDSLRQIVKAGYIEALAKTSDADRAVGCAGYYESMGRRD